LPFSIYEQLEVNYVPRHQPADELAARFGGQVIGQALVAACRTVEGRMPIRCIATSCCPANPQIPFIYEVDRLRDGKSYATRRVTAIQHGHAIFSMMVSFHVEEATAFNHQDRMPDVPPPDKLTAEELAKQPILGRMPEFIRRASTNPTADRTAPGRIRALFRQEDRGWPHSTSGFAPPPNCPTIRRCICARWPTPPTFRCSTRRWRATAAPCSTKTMLPASLDHAIRGFTARSMPTNGCCTVRTARAPRNGRGLTRGTDLQPDGTLVATVAQEGSLREAPRIAPHGLVSAALRFSIGCCTVRQQRIFFSSNLPQPAYTHPFF